MRHVSCGGGDLSVCHGIAFDMPFLSIITAIVIIALIGWDTQEALNQMMVICPFRLIFTEGLSVFLPWP